MKYLKRFNEDINNFKKEVEILFKNKNIVCLIAKSQKAAHIYGYKTKWCNVKKDRWEELTFDHKNIVIIVMFKNGYKLRLLYSKTHDSGDWGDSNGRHIFHFKKTDPFNIDKSNIKEEEYKEEELTAYEKIMEIPNECKEIIKNYIYNIEIDYLKRDTEYTSSAPKGREMYDQKNKYIEFKRETLPMIKDLMEDGDEIDVRYDSVSKKFVLKYNINKIKNKQEFKTIDELKDSIRKILQ
jgi:hypothetical protein